MEVKFLFEMDKGEYKVPVSNELYSKNFEYFKGMGMYDEAFCQEKALLITGFKIIRSNEVE